MVLLRVICWEIIPKTNLKVTLSMCQFDRWKLVFAEEIRVLGSHHVRIIKPIFHSDSLVVEISDGSLHELNAHLEKSSFHVVMYYAHWCARSRKLVYEFHRASKQFEGQVIFIAINCWAGSCRQINHFQSYPHLYFHHTAYNPVEYRGRHKTTHLVKFIQDAIYPFTYISNNIILQTFLEHGKPSLIAFFNGTNYEDKKYNEFFGATLHSTNKVSGLQFGVITSFQVASLIGLKTFGQVVLANALKMPQMYPTSLNFTINALLHWAEQNKIEYAEELEPDLTDSRQLGTMMKSSPLLILFLPKNAKDVNEKLLHLYHKVALTYHNCSCKTPDHTPGVAEDLPGKTPPDVRRREVYERACDELLKKPHVTSCQSLPPSYGYRYGMQNVCDVCQECCQGCSCDVNLFPLGVSTSTILRNLSPLHNSCRSLRKNYHESNFLSVCCFQENVPRYREMILSRSIDSLGDRIRTDLVGTEDLKILADRLEMLKGNINDAVSPNDPGILKRFLGKILTMFSLNTAEDRKRLLNETISNTAILEDVSGKSEYREYGTCDQRGKVRVFAGAGCYSNKTVKFYYMDSRKYWSYAKALGVRDDFPSRTALVIVDVMNEAQYVLPEEQELTNTSIVDFVMDFILGNLSRRLRSSPILARPCPNNACVIEVVSLTFDQLVLDPDKDVLLMYYTPWCGFCKSIKPIYLALADYYKQSMDVRIARINADLNDLPWEYTVDSYPSFVFFPARRKDLSVVYPDYEESTLENFIRFVEKHKRVQVTSVLGYSSRHIRVKILRLEREKNALKRQNNIFRWRLERELETRLEAGKKRLAAERQLVALLKDNLDDKRLRLDLEEKVRELTLENANRLGKLLETKEELFSAKEELFNTKEELFNTKGELFSTKEELFNTKRELFNTKGELFNTKEELFNTKAELRIQREDVDASLAVLAKTKV